MWIAANNATTRICKTEKREKIHVKSSKVAANHTINWKMWFLLATFASVTCCISIFLACCVIRIKPTTSKKKFIHIRVSMVREAYMRTRKYVKNLMRFLCGALLNKAYLTNSWTACKENQLPPNHYTLSIIYLSAATMQPFFFISMCVFCVVSICAYIYLFRFFVYLSQWCDCKRSTVLCI